jgi:spore coat polysaccharide biosynthesis predicted glycosyltransferase SpsG
MNSDIAVFTECSEQIGTGHLVESINLAKVAPQKNLKASVWIPDTAPKSLLDKFPHRYNFFHSFDSGTGADNIRSKLNKNGCKVILFNLRKISSEILSIFRYRDLKLICIDELGNRYLDCDAIINTSVVEKYRKYFTGNKEPRIYSGPEYLSMSPEFIKARLKEKTFNDEIRTVSVCMGGLDRTGVTLKIIDALSDWRPDVKKNIVLGAGSLYPDEAHNKITALKDKNFKVYHNVTYMASLLLESDVVFTAGGNTLYELACVGTPAIVLYEDEHEGENGMAFEKHGFGCCIGRGTDVNKDDILGALKKFEAADTREAHSAKGREIVDGKGSYRILDIIKDVAEYNTPIKAVS